MAAGPRSAYWSSAAQQAAKKRRLPPWLAARSGPQWEDGGGACRGNGPPSACCHPEVPFCQRQRAVEHVPHPQRGSASSGCDLSLGCPESKWMVEQKVAAAHKKLRISEIRSHKYDVEGILPLHSYQPTLTSSLWIHTVPFPSSHGHLPILWCRTLQHPSPFLHRFSLGNWVIEIEGCRGEAGRGWSGGGGTVSTKALLLGLQKHLEKHKMLHAEMLLNAPRIPAASRSAYHLPLDYFCQFGGVSERKITSLILALTSVSFFPFLPSLVLSLSMTLK